MNKIYTYKKSHFYWGIFILYCLFTICTIESYQLPWGDEHFFVDISLNYNETGKFITSVPSIHSPSIPREINQYGPLYFWCNAQLFSLFGLHIWTARILNLVFGLLNIFISILMLRKLNVDGRYILLFLVLIITDVNYNFIMHSGRMDLCALAFMQFAIYVYFFYKNSSVVKYFFVGLLIGIGTLFTPRLLLMLPLLIFYPLFEKTYSLKRGTFLNLVFVFIGLVSIYSLWIYFSYGGYKGFLDYYLLNNESDFLTNNTALQDYMLNGSLFNRLFRNTYVYIPRYILFYSALIFFFISKKVKKEGIIVFIALITTSFILLVVEHGSESYIAMVKPFMYIILIFTLPYLYNANKNKFFKYLLTLSLVLILSTQALFSSQKIVKIQVTANEINNSNTEQKIRSVIPRNSKVAADFRYFYDCIKNDCTFMLDVPGIYSDKPDYIITKDINFNDSNYSYITDLEYETWKLKSKFILLQKLFDITSTRNNYSTNAYIYKRKE